MQPVVAEYLKVLQSRLRLKAAILFGSAARGEADRWSDLDLCVISDELPADFRSRVDLLWKDKPAQVDVVGFRPGEMEEVIFRPMVLDILLEGQVVAGEAGELQQRAKEYLRSEGLERTPYGYARRRSVA